jgi:hypothetical protein
VRAPFITSHPVSQKVTEGETVVFAAGVAGTGYSCQWKLNGTNIPGATMTELTFTNVTYPYAGTYQLVASNNFGWVATRTAQLEVIPFAPVVARQPQSIAAGLGSIAWFDVLATGSGSLGYQWFFKEEPIAGATNSSLTISNVVLNQLGVYAVLVSNAYGVTASSNALLTLPTAEVIIDNPQASVTGAWISTVASGSYGSNCLVAVQGFGAGTARFSALLPRRGFYSVYEWHAQVNNRSVAVPCQIVTGSGTSNFSVNQGTLPGKWNLLGTYLFSADTEAAVIYADAFPDAGRVAVADAVRFVYVPAPPSIVLQPQDQIVPWGISASFSVVATGAQPLVFQWQRSGTNLTGAVATSLFWNAVHQGDAGMYSVFVTGPDGAALSRMASLSVAAPPLSMYFGGQDLVLDWSGPAVLQTATNVLGPYLELQDLPPFTNSTVAEPQRFFRLRLLPEPNHP